MKYLRSILLVAVVVCLGMPALAQDDFLGQEEREALVKLQSAKPNVRRDGLERLGKLKSRGASGEVARVAAVDPDPSVRREAVLALGRIGDRSRIPEMVAVLKDPDDKVRGAAVEGLVRLYLDREDGFLTRVRSGLVRITPFWDERQTATVEPYVAVDPRITEGLAQLLRTDTVERNRVAAARALGALRAESEIDALADAMAADVKLRDEVLDAFVLIGRTDAAQYAIPLFESPDASLAKQAMLTAGRLRAAQAVTPLLTVYGEDDPNKGVVGAIKKAFSPDRKKAAIQALALIGDARAEGVFTGNLYDGDEEIRRACYEGLARVADPRYVPLVTRNGYIERDKEVSLAQVFAQYKMKQPGMFPLIANGLRTGSLRDQAAQYIYEADSPDHLMPYLRVPDRKAQLVIIDALGWLGGQAEADALRPLVRGTAQEVALAADRSIRRIEWRLGQSGGTVPGP